MTKHFRSVLVAMLIGGLAISGLAQQNGDESEDSEDTELVEIEVQATPIEIKPGATTYTAEAISESPVGDGNLADLLRLNPAVDFSRSSDLSVGTATLRPDEISIHGNVFYQNLFVLDGADTTNDLNPAASGDMWSTPSLVAPHGGSSPQGYYVDLELLETVQVYDSNVPVEFGGFTGGVVASELKSYKGENSFSFTYGLQKDEWEEFHVSEEDITTADKYRGVYTPDYEKANYGISLQSGITENVGLTLGIKRRTSVFAQEYEDDTDTLRMIDYEDNIDNVVGRIDVDMDDFNYGLSFRYSRRAHDGLTSTTYTGMFVKAHEGMGTTFNFSTDQDFGSLDIKASIDQLSDTVDSDTSFFTYHEYLENSGISRFDGAFGDSNQQQTRWSIKPKWTLNLIESIGAMHRISVGGEIRGTESFYERPEDVIFEQFFCVRDMGREGCRDQDGDGVSSAGDEYLYRRSFWLQGEVNVTYEEISAYVEDIIEYDIWGDLGPTTLTVGARVDWESFLENLNLSPRFTASQSTEVGSFTVGLSRYYGRSFFRYELNDAIYGWRETYTHLSRPRGRPGEEIPCSNSDFVNCTHLFYDNRTGASDLDTPYSDEVSFGWSQTESGMIDATVQFVHRNNKDGVSRRRGEDRLYYYTNLGKSRSNSITATLTNGETIVWGQTNTHLSLSLGYRDSQSNRQDDDGYDEQLAEDLVYYESKLTPIDELPPWDYNIPFTIGFFATTEIPVWDVSWTNFVNHRRGGTIARDSRENYTDPTTQLVYDIYEDFDFDSLVTVNSKIRWNGKLTDRFTMFATLEINNLFDQIIDNSTVDTRRRYSKGRRFWIEVGTHFK